MCCQKSGITPGGIAKIAIMMLNTTPLAMAIIITNIFFFIIHHIISSQNKLLIETTGRMLCKSHRKWNFCVEQCGIILYSLWDLGFQITSGSL